MIALVIGLTLSITLGEIALSTHKRWAVGLFVSYLALIFGLSAAEVGFHCCYATTEGRLASNNWMARHWDENSMGYRDVEWQPADWQGKQTVLVVGDSVAVGWGIEDPHDRFSDVLGDLLGDDTLVMNIALPGYSTLDMMNQLADFPVQNPDTIIWQYSLNDIEGAAMRIGLDPKFDEPPDIVSRSHLLDYLYTRPLENVGFPPSYWQWQYDAYDNVGIWQVHEQELTEMVALAHEKGARLIVLIFPNMQDPVGTIPYVDRVAQVLDDDPTVEIWKLFNDVAAWDRDKAIVSIRDPHPSVAFHRYIAETLYERYFMPAQ